MSTKFIVIYKSDEHTFDKFTFFTYFLSTYFVNLATLQSISSVRFYQDVIFFVNWLYLLINTFLNKNKNNNNKTKNNNNKMFGPGGKN